jgi:hypothetical protein
MVGNLQVDGEKDAVAVPTKSPPGRVKYRENAGKQGERK